MKLQSLSIIFIIIIFPMILVFTYYLGLQIDTISLQNDYKNSLIDATSDAMSAFEINTANEELSNASDSLRTIVDASTNTFINTLSTSLGMSNTNKENIQPYIPAILYTMYDGYYIYSPTQTPEILEKTKIENGLTITEGAAVVGEKGVKYTGKVGGNNTYKYDEMASETTITSENESDVGALLYKREDGKYSPVIDDNTVMKTDYVLKSYMPYSGTYVEDDNNRVTIEYTLDNFMTVSGIIDGIYYTKSGYYINENLVTSCSISNWENMGQDEIKEICLDINKGVTINVNGIEIRVDAGYTDNVSTAKRKTITYYLTNTIFSKWVNENLGFCTGNKMQVAPIAAEYITDNLELLHDFSNDTQIIFAAGSDPEAEDSKFNNHKYNIIKNSIQYNLNLAMSSYNEMFFGINFEMPQLSDSEWEQITEKLSIVSFLQGIDCGLKNYNGYAVVSSTNNEMTIIPEEIYYVKKDEFNKGEYEDYYYHRLDCELLSKNDDGTPYTGDYISFVSKEVKYDDIYLGDSTGKYEYDHKNLACYECIVQNNYAKQVLNSNLQKAYYIAVAKERQNLYKTTEHSQNEGIIIYQANNPLINNLEKVSKFEITLKNTNTSGGIVKQINLNIGGSANISGTTTANQTITIDNKTTGNKHVKVNGTNIEVLSIKVIYK